mmetsp:Transcript_56069/g.170727  ORF Transcript_56069/g.170727 Transcript_56069/m.170727 type:complete len:436 (-) Transcript_56069:81-1388(-)
MSSASLASLRHEVGIYLSVDHTHIARLHHVYETPAELHLVMEYLSGGELLSRVRHGSGLREDTAAGLVQQMLLPVVYLHAHDIAHRDLKLENYVFEAEGSSYLKLIDFGLSRRRVGGADARMKKACGSVDYVAPEVFTRSYTEKADVWSLGVITYMLLVGVPLFGGSKQEIMAQVKAGEMKFSPRLSRHSAQAQDFLRRLLVVDPDARASASAALEHPWLQARAGWRPPALDPPLLAALGAFVRSPAPQRALLSVVARSVAEEDRGALRRQFFGAADPRRGVVTRAQLQRLLAGSGGDVAEVLHAWDAAQLSELTYTDFLAAALQQGHFTVQEDLLQRTFACFDREGRGQVSEEDSGAVLGLAPRGAAGATPPGDGDMTSSEEDLDEFSSTWSDLFAETGNIGFEDFAGFLRDEIGLKVELLPAFSWKRMLQFGF